MKQIVFLLLFFSAGQAQSFQRGVNITEWFQSSGAHQIQFSKYTRQDLEDISSLGCDVIRLPINLHAMTGGPPGYPLDPLLFTFLDPVVDWAEELHLSLILDDHSFNPAVETPPDIDEILVPVWQQMARHYKNRSRFIYYEVLNEPHGISDSDWNTIQQKVINAIREIDSVHTIVVGPAGWNSFHNLQQMPNYADSNLLYTFHFYEPLLFTHQGASWTSPPMVSLSGMPWPYDPNRMPDCPDDLKGTWVESAMDDYSSTGTVGHLHDMLDIAVNFKEQRHVPLYCGEMGVYMPNSPPVDRRMWYQVTRSYLEEKGIAWTMWDYRGGFGLFKKGSNQLFDYDLNTDLLKALGFNVPEQKAFIPHPDSTGFWLYKNGFEHGIYEASWNEQGVLDYYSDKSEDQSDFCMYWQGATQYSKIGFDFIPNRDFTLLKDRGYVLDLWIKGDTPQSALDLRFLDTKTEDPDDHPWRMNYTLSSALSIWDNQWHHLQIALTDFIEGGSWDNGWYAPQGAFDWTAVDQFQIVAEHLDLTGMQFWFDNIQIMDPNAVGIRDKKHYFPESTQLYCNYPNPFGKSRLFDGHAATIIGYLLKGSLSGRRSTTSHVHLTVYNILGQKVRELVNTRQLPGSYSVTFDAGDLPNGIYFYRLSSSNGFSESRKMLLIR